MSGLRAIDRYSVAEEREHKAGRRLSSTLGSPPVEMFALRLINNPEASKPYTWVSNGKAERLLTKSEALAKGIWLHKVTKLEFDKAINNMMLRTFRTAVFSNHGRYLYSY